MATVRIAVIVIVIFSVSTIPNAKETLRFGALVSQEGELDYSGQLLTLELALQTVNNDSSHDLLHSFNVTVGDDVMVSRFNT